MPATQTLLPTELFQFLGVRKDEPFIPFPAQAEALSAVRIPWPGRNDRTGKPYPRLFGFCMGRRFGKTTLGEKLLWQGLIAPDDRMGPPTVRLTADTEEHALKIWRPFIHHLLNTPLNALLDDYSREHQRVVLKTGANAQMISANNPQAMSGDGVSLWLVDEAQFFKQEAMDNMFPSIADRHGIIVMLGVAQGEGPFKEVCMKGDDEEWPEFCHMTFPTAANPFIDPWDIELARRVNTPALFEQLYEARWVGELGKVFTNIDACKSGDKIYRSEAGYGYTELPRKGAVYYGGIDLARLQDWTVYTIWDRHGRMVAWDRFNSFSWELQYNRLALLSAKYGHPLTYVDSTGVGDPPFEALMAKGMSVAEYKIVSNERKRALIDELAIRIANAELRYPDIRVFIRELERMETKNTPGSSLIKYEAPFGMTDDFVVSAALAMQAVPRKDRMQIHSEIEEYLWDELTRQPSAYESL